MNSKKKTGSYYTPLDLADFIVQHLKPSLNDTNSILEPSVGDGAFIKTIIANNIPVNQISLRSVGTFPCNQLAAEFFNGGGHLNASGGEFFGTMEEAKAVFEKALEKYKPLLTAKS